MTFAHSPSRVNDERHLPTQLPMRKMTASKTPLDCEIFLARA